MFVTPTLSNFSFFENFSLFDSEKRQRQVFICQQRNPSSPCSRYVPIFVVECLINWNNFPLSWKEVVIVRDVKIGLTEWNFIGWCEGTRTERHQMASCVLSDLVFRFSAQLHRVMGNCDSAGKDPSLQHKETDIDKRLAQFSIYDNKIQICDFSLLRFVKLFWII